MIDEKMIENAQNEARERIKREVIELCAYEGYADEANAKILAENASSDFTLRDIEEASEWLLDLMETEDDLVEFFLWQELMVDGNTYCWINPVDSYSWKDYIEDDVKVALGLIEAEEACWA